MISINFADQSSYVKYLKDPDLLRRVITSLESRLDSSARITIAIDEVQRIPSILNTVQALIDERPKQRIFLLTGSSARKLKKGQANLLPGRVFYRKLFPLTYWELHDRFDADLLEKILVKGSLPEVLLEDYGDQILDSYVETYLREEIQAEALTKDLGAYSRFLDLAALVSGEYLNYAKIASDSEINKETIRRYFSILEDTLLIYRIPSYGKFVTARKVRQKDKFIFCDLGIRNALLKKLNSNFTSTEKGPLLEQWLLQQIIAYVSYNRKNWRISTFRDEYDNEVDLIVETATETYAIEIKYGQRFKKSWTKGLLAFEKLLDKPIQMSIVYLGTELQKENKISIYPLQHFLEKVIPSI
jgi:predicted AAA+ superfamily ATPase